MHSPSPSADRTPTPAEETELATRRLRQFFHFMAPMHAGLAHFELDALERKQMGGQVLPYTRALLQSVANSLDRRPELFPDAPFTGPELRADNAQAGAFLILHEQLSTMARLCLDGYLRVLSRAGGAARRYVNQVAAGPAPRGLTEAEAEHRFMILSPAFLLLIVYYKTQKKQRNKRAQAKTAPPPTHQLGAYAQPMETRVQQNPAYIQPIVHAQPIAGYPQPIAHAQPIAGYPQPIAQQPPGVSSDLGAPFIASGGFPVPGAFAQPRKPAPTKTPQRRRADADRREHERRAVVAQFEAFLHRNRRTGPMDEPGQERARIAQWADFSPYHQATPSRKIE